MAIIVSLIYFDNVLKFLGSVCSVVFPLVLGICIAYVLNMIVQPFEEKFPKMNRAISITLTLLLVIGILTLMSVLVIPQFTDACLIIKDAVPKYYNQIQSWIIENKDKIPMIADQISQLKINWDSLFQDVIAFATNSTGTLVSTTFSIIGSFTVGVFNVFIALIFAIYVLSCKEKIYRNLMRTLSTSKYTKVVHNIIHILKTSDKCFSSFVIGQCKEAFILGFLCMIGMFIICPKYAVMIGVLIGITAFIPILGAYIGASIGAFVVFTEDPMKALYFIIFIIILQQVEGNLIYPKVVGVTVGIPGILVFAAVTIGGGLAGIAGMFLGVPIMAVLYQFYNEYLNKYNPKPVQSNTPDGGVAVNNSNDANHNNNNNNNINSSNENINTNNNNNNNK